MEGEGEGVKEGLPRRRPDPLHDQGHTLEVGGQGQGQGQGQQGSDPVIP